MSTEFTARISQEHTPQSPASLDSKILEYAEANRPQSNSRRYMPWMSFVATCSVLVISVLFVLRTPSGDAVLDVMSSDNNRSVIEVESMPVLSDTSREKFQSSETRMLELRSREREQQSRTRSVREERTHEEGDRQAKESDALNAVEMLAPQPVYKRQVTVTAARMSTGGGSPEVENVSDGRADGYSLEQAEGSLLEQADGSLLEQADGSLLSQVDDSLLSQVDDSLRELRVLVEQGEIEKAAVAFSALLEGCRQCDLPESLEQALAELKIRDAQ